MDFVQTQKGEKMDDLISRQTAIDALMEFDKKLRKINWYQYPYVEHECRGVDKAIVKIANLPSAQPELIRCKDCIFYDGRPCGIVDWYNTANDFCSKAERNVDDRY